MALRRRPIQTASGRAFEGALEASLAVVVGGALGYYADRWLGTEPVLLFVFLIVGSVAGFRRLLRIQWIEPEKGGDGTGRGSDEPEQ